MSHARKQNLFGRLLGTKRSQRRSTARRLLFEGLEGRQLMTADLGGNSLGAATDLGALSGSRQVADFVGQADTNDYYRFRLNDRGELRLDLNGLSADADLALISNNGSTLASSVRGGSNSELITRTLDPGEYVVRVYRYSGDTNYQLTLSVANQSAPPDNAGNSLGQARDLGTLNGTVALQDFVGQADQADFYRFRVAGQSNFRLRMDGLSADADVYVLNSIGQVIASSTRSGSNAEAVDRVLADGDFFVQVFPYGAANTNYRLGLNVSTAPAPAVTSIGGFSSQSAGVRDGLVDMSLGTRWNGYRVVNDQPGVYTWTIRGTDFGASRGQVRLAGREVPVLSWSATSIRIDPTGAQINPNQPTNWGALRTALEVQTADGRITSSNVDLVPAIRTRVYGQCTWHVANRRLEMGLNPSPSAYGGYTSFSATWVPQVGDQLQWNGAHTAIIESVSAPVVNRNVTTYTLVISQYNAGSNNEYSTYTTSFQVTGRTVTALPKFRDRGSNASQFYR